MARVAHKIHNFRCYVLSFGYLCIDPPSAPTVSVTGINTFNNFNLTIGSPSVSASCVMEYYLVLTRVQDGVTIFNGTFPTSMLVNGSIDLLTIDSSIQVLTCNCTHTFELTPVGGSKSSGIQTGDPNFDGM